MKLGFRMRLPVVELLENIERQIDRLDCLQTLIHPKCAIDD